MVKRSFFILFLLTNSLLVFGQQSSNEVSNGSIYSRFGVGMPTDFGSSGADGEGLQGVSLNEPLVSNVANPALWGSTVYGMATGGLGINNYSGKDSNSSSNHSNLYLNQFQLQLPLIKNKVGVSFSFSPYTTADYKVRRPRRELLPTGTSADTLDFTTVNTGSGGISQYELGVGWKINRYVSLGYAASLVHASIDNNYVTSFTNNPTYAQVNSTLQTSGSGFGNRIGAYFTLPSLSKADEALSLGVTVNMPVDIHGQRIQQSTYVSSNPNDENGNVEQTLATGDIHLPLGVSAGLTYKPSRRVAVSTEGRFDRWSKYSNDLNQSLGDVAFTNRFKGGAGVNFYPYYSGSDKFLSHFKYRFGASYDTGHLKINSEQIHTFMISAGLGILSPSKVSGFNSSVDISVHYGIRGTQSNNLVKERFWGVKLSVNLAELFFFRPKYK